MNDRDTLLRLFDAISQCLCLLNRKLDRVLAGLKIVERNEVAMTQEMNDLIQEVKDTVGAEQSAVLALTGLEKQLADAIAQLAATGADVSALHGLKNTLSDSRLALAAAIANAPPAPQIPVPNPPVPEPTPAPPAPEPVPAPTPEPAPEPPTP